MSVLVPCPTYVRGSAAAVSEASLARLLRINSGRPAPIGPIKTDSQTANDEGRSS